MVATRRTLPDGPAGVTQTLQALTAAKDFYGSLSVIRAAAITIAGSEADNDEANTVAQLARFVRRAVVYLADPLNSELIITPEVMLSAINDTGFTYGDCDDHCLLFASLCEACGIPCDIAGVAINGAMISNHVICIAHLSSGPTQVDLCAKPGPGSVYPNPEVVSS